jgi:glycosyltransferase involved in cell wall biosynthesis
MYRKGKISIIIATYNAEQYLEQAIQSIIRQSYSEKEFIIIDGGSTDKTVAIFKNFEVHISFWNSEPDKGIYDAWNKGIEKATGEWIMFLGADDTLLEGALEAYMDYIQQSNGNFEYICSKLIMVDSKGKHIREKGSPWVWDEFKYVNHLAHPGSLHHVSIFEKYGKFNLDYKITGDYELLLRAGNCLKAGFINKVTVLMREGGASSGYQALKEHKKAMVKTAKVNGFFAATYHKYLVVKLFVKNALRGLGINFYLRK